MARMPGTIWMGEHGSRRMERYDIVCIHTIVGYSPAHAAHFSVDAEGNIIQSRDTYYQSGANLDGNHRIIAVELEDHGPAFGGTPRDTTKWPPYTDAQVAAVGRILRWAHDTHGVPLQLCPDSRSTSRGLAYHRQGIDGNFGRGTAYPNPGRVEGGEVWTKARGKVCPGDARINQRPAILAAARGEDEMAAEDVNQIKAALKNLQATLNQVLKELRAFRKGKSQSDQALRRGLAALADDVKDDATRAQVRNRTQKILDELAEITAAAEAEAAEEVEK